MNWCSECRSFTGHKAGCPNAPIPPPVFECEWCGAAIRAGEEYYELCGDRYHKECCEENAVDIMKREEIGLVQKTAQYEGE